MTNIKIVIGANYGDEGKGLMTDYFCNLATESGESALVVCANGGSQRGHTVTTPGGINHVFHHFGSGTFAGADTYLSEKFILNPMNYYDEYIELSKKTKPMPMVYINKLCKVTTPFDMIINQMAEESRGSDWHGSCGCGIWETITRDGATVEEMWDMYLDGNLASYIKSIRDNYLPLRLKELGVKITDEWKEVINKDTLITNWMFDFHFMMRTTEWETDAIIKEYDHVIFENGQGLMLTDKYISSKYATPSETGIYNPAQIILKVFWGAYSEVNLEVCYVTRPYITRHGPGKLEGECTKEEVNVVKDDETNVYNIHQGDFRYAKMNWKSLVERVKDDYSNFKVGQLSIAFTHWNEASKEMDSSYYDWLFDNDEWRVYFSCKKTRDGVM